MADDPTVGDVTISAHINMEIGLLGSGRAPIAPKRRTTPAKLKYSDQNSSTVGGVTNGSPGGDTVATEFHEFSVDLVKGPKGLGFSIVCRLPDNTDVFPNAGEVTSAGPLRIYVKELLPDGVAAIDGRIQPGDCILKVNEFDLSNVPYTTAANILRNITGVARLLMARKKSSDQVDHVERSVDNTVTVTVDRPAASTFNTTTIVTSSPVTIDNGPTVTTPSVTVGDSAEVMTSAVTAVNDARLIAPLDDVIQRSVVHNAPIDDVTATRNTDINGNDKRSGHLLLLSETLRHRLNEAKQRRVKLAEQLKEVNSQIARVNAAGVKGDETMEQKLADAELATHQAQRNLIELQASLSASQSEYLAHESNLRQQILELQLKYQNIENTVDMYRNRDEEYTAAREKVRERHLSRESHYEKQLNVLNNKLQRLEAGGLNSLDSGSSPVIRERKYSDAVTLVSHVRNQRDDVLDLPVVISIPRPPEGSTFDDQRANRLSSSEYLQVPSTATALFDAVDSWSIMDQRLEDEPPNYPPPPVPDDIDSDTDSDIVPTLHGRPTLAVSDQPRTKTAQPLRDNASERGSLGRSSIADGGSIGSRYSGRGSPFGESVDGRSRSVEITSKAMSTSGSDAKLNNSGDQSAASGTLERQRKKDAKQRNSAAGGGSSAMQPLDRLRRMFGSRSASKELDEKENVNEEERTKNTEDDRTATRQDDSLTRTTMTSSSVSDLDQSKKSSGKSKKFRLSIGGKRTKSEDMSASTFQSTVSIDGTVTSAANEPRGGNSGDIVQMGSKSTNHDVSIGYQNGNGHHVQRNTETGRVNTTETGSRSTTSTTSIHISGQTNNGQNNGTLISDLNPRLADHWTADDLYKWLTTGPVDRSVGAYKLKSFNIDGLHLLRLNSAALKGLGLDGKERDYIKKASKELQTAVNREKKQQEKMSKKS